jgi:hypothetical protein
MVGRGRGRLRALVAVAVVAFACAVPAAVASSPGKVTAKEVHAKRLAEGQLYIALDAVLKQESGELASFCEGVKQHPGPNLRTGLKKVTTNLQANLDKFKAEAKGLEKWADGLDARAAQHVHETQAARQLIKEASGSLLIAFSAYEDAIDELHAIAGEEGNLQCQQSYRKPLLHLNDAADAADKGFSKLEEAVGKYGI